MAMTGATMPRAPTRTHQSTSRQSEPSPKLPRGSNGVTGLVKTPRHGWVNDVLPLDRPGRKSGDHEPLGQGVDDHDRHGGHDAGGEELPPREDVADHHRAESDR